MRFALVLACLLPAVHAQPLASPEPATSERISKNQRVVIASVGVVGAIAAGVGVGLVLGEAADTPFGAPFVLVAIPVGATLMMQRVGESVGAEAPVWSNARDFALGVGAGSLALAAGAGLGYLIEVEMVGDSEVYVFGPLIGGLVGGLAGTVLLVRLSTRSFRMAPAAMAAPTGQRVPGLSLRLSL